MPQIPDFPDFCEVSLPLAGEVQPLLRDLQPEISEFTFANLFLFRTAHSFQLSRWKGLLLVLGRGYDQVRYAYPPIGQGNVEEASKRLCAHLVAQAADPVLFPVPRSWVETYFSGPSWSAEPDRDQADYVYRRYDLAHLEGKKYHKRRNRLLKYLREEAQGYSYAKIAEEHIPQCMALAEAWCGIRCSPARPTTFLETEAVKEALVHRRVLTLSGGVVSLEGRVRAFCLGQELSPETFVVHFEKTEPGRDGLAQLINRDFCRNELAKYEFVNREQDLGDPGLRRAKQGYHPVLLAEKYRVRPV